MSRPPTSKPRGLCRYYDTPRGCFAGDSCKFLHGLPSSSPEDPPLLTPYDKAKRCRHYAQGFCKRGDACWFLHVPDTSPDEDDETCSICLEKPTTYALLSGCSHIFCTTCIKQWRDPQNKPGGVAEFGNTKKCPLCRMPSKFFTPSSKFWRDGTPEKAAVTQAYKDSMARVPCRYFQKSIQKNKEKPMCPYGKDCFYQHVKEDGTPYVFKDGVDVSMRRYRRHQFQRRGLSFADMHILPLGPAGLDFVVPMGENEGESGVMRRLEEEMGRSLEMLHDAIVEFPFFDNLEFAVETARTGLGHRTTRRRRDEEFRAFLQSQTDQMIASLNRMHSAEHEETGGSAEGYETDASMPRLQSTSSTEDEYEGRWSEEEEEEKAESEEEGEEEGPFVTDGRGRAVWTGPGEENKRDGDGDGGGWINALF